MFRTFADMFKNKDIRNRIFFTLAMLFVFRFGSAITVPGVDVTELIKGMQDSSLFAMINMPVSYTHLSKLSCNGGDIMKGILGRKLGMTQVFTEDGTLIPVTVVEACPNVVLQKKTVENDGYEAVQLGFEDVKETRSTKGEAGHAAKANTAPKRFVKEVRDSEFADLELGAEDVYKRQVYHLFCEISA